MRPVDKLESFGEAPVSYPEAVAAIRAEHGRGSSHWLADELELGLRQAQRYLSAHPPQSRRPDVIALAPSHQIIAGRLRRATGTTSGMIKVDYSPTGTSRSIPDLDAGAGELRGLLDEAADQFAAGQRYLAATAFEQYILLGYGYGAMPEQMSIVEYVSGVELQLGEMPEHTLEPSTPDHGGEEPATTGVPLF